MTERTAALILGHARLPESARTARPGQSERLAQDTPEAQAAAWVRAVQQQGPRAAAASARGDFAVAVPLPDGRVFLAVDRFAVRSLCYRIDGGQLRWAARADALGDGTLAPQALFDYLYFHVVPSPRTVFEGVHRLPPGHCAIWADGRLELMPYWVPDFQPVSQPSFDALKGEFMGLLEGAVERQLDGSRPACFLSGGTDSSTVAGMMARAQQAAGGERPVAYSVGFEADGYDEMAYARIAARHFGCEHREVYYTPEDLLRDIPVVAAGYDQPFGNSSALPSFHCSSQARADGVTRILAGDGGDELFGGNSRYATQRLFEHWERVPGVLRRGVLEPFFNLGPVSRAPLLRKGTSYIRQANTPLPDRAQDYNLIRRLGYSEVFTPAMLAQVDTGSVDVQQRAVWAQAHAEHGIDRHLAFDWRYTLAEADLPKVVGTTGQAGLSVGFPMLDEALVDFSMKLPPDYKLRGAYLRWFFKEALKGFLPDEVITKKKQGFGLPFGVWMVQHPGLHALAKDALDGVVARGIVRAEFIKALFERHLPEHPHYYGTMVWILIMLEHWLRRHAPDWRVAR